MLGLGFFKVVCLKKGLLQSFDDSAILTPAFMFEGFLSCDS